MCCATKLYGEEDSRQTTFYVHYLNAHTKNLLRRRRRFIFNTPFQYK